MVSCQTVMECVCGGTEVSAKSGLLSHVQKAWCHSTPHTTTAKSWNGLSQDTIRDLYNSKQRRLASCKPDGLMPYWMFIITSLWIRNPSISDKVRMPTWITYCHHSRHSSKHIKTEGNWRHYINHNHYIGNLDNIHYHCTTALNTFTNNFVVCNFSYTWGGLEM